MTRPPKGHLIFYTQKQDGQFAYDHRQWALSKPSQIVLGKFVLDDHLFFVRDGKARMVGKIRWMYKHGDPTAPRWHNGVQVHFELDVIGYTHFDRDELCEAACRTGIVGKNGAMVTSKILKSWNIGSVVGSFPFILTPEIRRIITAMGPQL